MAAASDPQTQLKKALNDVFAPRSGEKGNILFVGELHEYNRIDKSTGHTEKVTPTAHMTSLKQQADTLKELRADVIGVESGPYMNTYFQLYEQKILTRPEFARAVKSIAKYEGSGEAQAEFWMDMMDKGVSVRGVDGRFMLERIQQAVDDPTEKFRPGQREQLQRFISTTEKLLSEHPEIAADVAAQEAYAQQMYDMNFTADAVSAKLLEYHLDQGEQSRNGVVIFGDSHRNGAVDRKNAAFGIMDDVLVASGYRVTEAYIGDLETLQTMYSMDRSKQRTFDQADWVLITDTEINSLRSSKADVAERLGASYEPDTRFTNANLPKPMDVFEPTHIDFSEVSEAVEAFKKLSGGEHKLDGTHVAPGATSDGAIRTNERDGI